MSAWIHVTSVMTYVIAVIAVQRTAVARLTMAVHCQIARLRVARRRVASSLSTSGPLCRLRLNAHDPRQF